MIPDISLEDLPTREENMESLFESFLKEQTALSNLIRLEAKKMDTFTGEMDFPFANWTEDIYKFVQSTKRISDLITMKGLFLKQKLQEMMLIDEKFSVREEEEENTFDYLESVYGYIYSIENMMEAIHNISSDDFYLSKSMMLLKHIHQQMQVLNQHVRPKKEKEEVEEMKNEFRRRRKRRIKEIDVPDNQSPFSPPPPPPSPPWINKK